MTTFTTEDREFIQRQPLTELQIKQLHKYVQDNMMALWAKDEDPKPFMIEFARAIERAHGIDQA